MDRVVDIVVPFFVVVVTGAVQPGQRRGDLAVHVFGEAHLATHGCHAEFGHEAEVFCRGEMSVFWMDGCLGKEGLG